MILRSLLAALLAMGLAACTSLEVGQGPGAQQPPYPPDAFAHRVATSHVVLYWNCGRPEANVLRLDGVAQNPWSPQEVQFLEFELVGVGGEERVVSQTKGEVRDFMLRTNQISPFRLELRTVGSEARFDLYYQYQFQDMEIKALLAGPPVGGLRLLAYTNRFLARDVCAETKHRVR
jgi:hypothetical protein